MKKSLVIMLLFIFLSPNICAGETVVYNTKTQKYHQTWCRWAKKCTVNCIKVDKKEAIKRGGKPCKVCGG